MTKQKAYFKIELPTKTFLKKYLFKEYGNPVLLSDDSPLGQLIACSLDKPIFPTKAKTIVHQNFDHYSSLVVIFLPMTWLTKYYYGTALSEKSAVFINKFLEGMFEKDLATFCENRSEKKGDRQDAMYAFCDRYGIEIPEDITFDNLKQTEYRYRRAAEERLREAELYPLNSDAGEAPPADTAEKNNLACPLSRPPAPTVQTVLF